MDKNNNSISTGALHEPNVSVHGFTMGPCAPFTKTNCEHFRSEIPAPQWIFPELAVSLFPVIMAFHYHCSLSLPHPKCPRMLWDRNKPNWLSCLPPLLPHGSVESAEVRESVLKQKDGCYTAHQHHSCRDGLSSPASAPPPPPPA